MKGTPSHPVRGALAVLATLTAVVVVVVVAVVVAPVSPVPAWAHNQVLDTTPAADAVLVDPPERVELTFVERLDPKYTAIVVTDADEQPVATTPPEVSGTRGSVTFTAPLNEGVYTVAYRVVSADGHPVQGSYSFSVAAAGTASPGGTALPDGTASPAPGTSGSAGTAGAGPGAGTFAAVAGGLVLLSAGAGYLWWRRRGTPA